MRNSCLNFCIFLIVTIVPATALAQTWSAADLSVEMGTVAAREPALTVKANQQGQVLLGIPASGMALHTTHRAHFTFQGPPPARIYLIWRRSNAKQLLQHGFATNGSARPTLDLGSVTGWQGHAESLQVGFLLEPGAEVTLQEISLNTPGMLEVMSMALQNWSTFRPWLPVDINLLTGTREFNKGPYPAQVFAISTLLLLLAYLAWRRRRAKWTGVAMVIFCSWLALDALWQWRLWQQLGVTRATYEGLDSEGKILASERGGIANLARQAHRAIDTADPKIYVASQSDRDGMNAAYYLSPYNTYWYRHGAELPENDYLQTGDYILVVKPSITLYDRSKGLMRLPPGQPINVVEHYADEVGLLLEVAP